MLRSGLGIDHSRFNLAIRWFDMAGTLTQQGEVILLCSGATRELAQQRTEDCTQGQSTRLIAGKA